jgi:hydrogenase maturation protease
VNGVVVGVGNAYRGDDRAGLAVAELLRDRLPAGWRIVACEQEPSRLLDAWAGAEAAIVVDATACGAGAGTLHRFDASGGPVPARTFRSSTHVFGVGDAIELARALGTLPPRVLVYGVEGGSFTAGEELTDAVAATVGEAAAAVLTDVVRLEEEPCTSER